MDWNKKTLYERIVDRWAEKETDYSKVNRNRDLITTFFRSDELIEVDDKGNLLGQDIYNAAGPWYSRLMATGFQGSLVSKNIPWIRYQMRQDELRGIDELDIWAQEIQEFMTGVYQRSNFYDVQPQFTLDGITTGSPIMFAEENILKQKTIWRPQHYKKVRMYYDGDNEIEGVIVKDKNWTAKQIFDTFVKTDDEKGTKRNKLLTLAVNKALESGQLNKEFLIYRAVFRENDPMWNGEGKDKFKKPAGDWTWISVYFQEITEIENDGDKRNKPLNENMGYFSQPFAIWNYDKKPWEASSRTPAFYAIWDNISLQQIDKNYIENIQLKNRPPRIFLDSMKNRIDFSPEGRIEVSSSEYKQPPKALDMIGDVRLEKELMDMKDEALRRWFLVDFFRMFSDLVRQQKQPVTATQIWQMAGEKATLLSPAIETHSRYLDTSDDRMMNIEQMAGRGPFHPEKMLEITQIVLANIKSPIGNFGVVPVFIGALAQAQKVSQQLKPIQATMEAVSPLFDRNPQLMFMYRWYKTVNKINEALDFPQDSIIPEEEYDELVKADNEAKTRERQQLMAIEMAKASKNVSGPVDPDSILAGVAGAAAGEEG